MVASATARTSSNLVIVVPLFDVRFPPPEMVAPTGRCLHGLAVGVLKLRQLRTSVRNLGHEPVNPPRGRPANQGQAKTRALPAVYSIQRGLEAFGRRAIVLLPAELALGEIGENGAG